MSKIQQAVEELGSYNSPYYLKQLGFTENEINRAVQDGELEWTRYGNLNVTTHREIAINLPTGKHRGA